MPENGGHGRIAKFFKFLAAYVRPALLLSWTVFFVLGMVLFWRLLVQGDLTGQEYAVLVIAWTAIYAVICTVSLPKETSFEVAFREMQHAFTGLKNRIEKNEETDDG